MSSTDRPECPQCGAPIPAGAAARLCPACLLSVARRAPGDGPVGISWGEPLTAPADSGEFPRMFGDYRLLGVFGRGGMGTVYEAEQLATGRRLALKVLTRELDSPEMRQRFLREGRLAAGVSHPNSLYVFGTEEIDGHPVIVMEIAGAGTLDDRLRKNGPLPVAEAVDATLGIIDGLEAAFAGGVLHRDIKPSNCFVGPDGSTKIGDFGLSVSTSVKPDSFATGEGVILGTPAFASPEQLRGTDLDVRSDIYAVGATLYSLLSGEPSAKGRNAVEVVAAALEEKPKSLNDVRNDIPRGLAHVVARCLAKKPAQRYPDYAPLRRALLPFSSARPEGAPLGRRFFAGCIDFAVCAVIPAVLILSFFGVDILNENALLSERAPIQLRTWIGHIVGGILYFAIFEGIWGAGAGKALLGLRVVRPDGQAPGAARALARSAIGRTLGDLGKIFALVTLSAAAYQPIAPLVSVGSGVIGGLAFVTMRRRNGFATLWDLATGTRVVVKPEGAVRPSTATAAVMTPRASLPAGESIGPYLIEEEVASGRWLAARDPDLRRTVWLRRAKSDLSVGRRDVARPGRKRWLQCVETPDAKWDVFEALPGAPLTVRISEGGGRLPWESLRHWLYDLASEIGAAAEDGTLPQQLGLDHVWITQSGRAILLDEPWPRTEHAAPLFDVGDLAGRQRFLAAVASHADRFAVPLHAQPVLESLAAGSFERLSFLTGSLRSVLTKPAVVDARLRAASLFALPLALIVVITVSLAGYGITKRPLPPLVELKDAAENGIAWAIERHAYWGSDLNERDRRGDTPLITAALRGHTEAAAALLDHGAEIGVAREDGATALHLAALFGHTEVTRLLLEHGADREAQDARGRTPLDWADRPWTANDMAVLEDMDSDALRGKDLERILIARRDVSLLLRQPPLPSLGSSEPPSRPGPPMSRGPYGDFVLQGLVILYGLAFVQVITQFIGICLFRGTAGQLFFGFAVVDRTGAGAGRLRLLWRWAISWAVPVAVLVQASPATYEGSHLAPLAFLGLWLLGVAAAVLHPARGLQDRLSGCWLVPR